MLRGQALLSSLHGVRSISIVCLLADCDGASIRSQISVGLWVAVLVVEVLAVGGWDCLRLHGGCNFSCIVKDFVDRRCAVLWDQSYHFLRDTGEVC